MGARIVGVFDQEQAVIKEIERYESQGYSRDHFSVITRDDRKIENLTQNMGISNEGDLGFLGALRTIMPTIGASSSTPINSSFFPQIRTNYDMIDRGETGESLGEEYVEHLAAGKILLLLK